MTTTDEQHNIKKKFNIIADARKIHIINQSRRISDNTRQYYNKVARRLLIKDKILPIDVASSKNSYYVYKAAILSYLMDTISNTIPKMDFLRKSDHQQWLTELDNLKLYLDFIDAIGLDQNKDNLAKAKNGEYRSEWAIKAESKQLTPKKSKSTRLRTLPKDWTQKIFAEAVRTKSTHVLAIATLSITGCRPIETNGVELILNADESIKVKIKGAKTHGGQYGQEYRMFDVKCETPEHLYLRDELTKNLGKLTIATDPGALCDKVSYLSRKTMPQLKEQASAYCYRHKFSGELHKSKLDTESIAMALGHSNDQSQQHYSRSYRTGTDSFSISNIKTSKNVILKNHNRFISKNTIYNSPEL